MNWRKQLRLFIFCLIIGLLIAPAFADEQEINLDSTTPYIDIPIQVTEPNVITIETTTGTPQTNPAFIDSWIELWQDTTRLAFNDDGAHSATNYLASIINMPIEIGEYFIRATSYAYMCCSVNVTGSYLLTWQGAEIIPTPSPTPTITPTLEPTIEPTPEVTPTIIPEPETQQPVAPEELHPVEQQEILIPIIPTPEPSQQIETEYLPEASPQELPILEPIETPIIETIEITQEELNQEYILENTIQLELPTALQNIPGVAEVFAATEAIMNVGSDMTEQQREESQAVVVGAIIVTQIASVTSISVRKIK